MKVWVVTWHDWVGACYVCGVFSTKEKAREYYNTSPDFYDEPVEVEVDQEVRSSCQKASDV